MLKKLIDRPVTVTMAMLSAIVIGIVSLRIMPVSLAPDVDIPYITVRADAANLSASEIDKSIVSILSDQFIQIAGLKDLSSQSIDGSAVITLSFEHGEDIDYQFIEVNEKVDRAMDYLPDISRPRIMKASASDIPAFYLSICLKINEKDNNFSQAFLQTSEFASTILAKRIEQLPEVAMIDITGAEDYQISIIPKDNALESLNLSIDDLKEIISASNINIGNLSITDGQFKYNISFSSNIRDVEEIKNIKINSGGKILNLEEIADIRYTAKPKTGEVVYQGKKSIYLAVIKQSDAKMANLKKSFASLVEQFRKDYPQLEFSISRDQTMLLEYSINNLFQNILIGIMLVCIVIFLFMGDLRTPSLVVLTMPASLIVSMAFFNIAGLSINIISLSGLLIGVGMLTDNAVVLIDNITYRWKSSSDLRNAVLEGTEEVSGPMLSSVLTTCAVFIPLIFIRGISGALFYEQAIAITIVLLVSWMITIIVIPVYYYWWFKGESAFKPNKHFNRLSFFNNIESFESKTVVWFMNHSRLSVAIFIISILGSIICFIMMPKEQLPQITYDDTLLTINWNRQLSLESNKEYTSNIRGLAEEQAQQVTALIGNQDFLLPHSGNLSNDETIIYFKCGDTKTLNKIKDNIVRYLNKKHPDAIYHFNNSANIFDIIFSKEEAPLVAKLRATASDKISTEKLDNAIKQIRNELNYEKISAPAVKESIRLTTDQQALSLYSMNPDLVENAINGALNGNKATNINRGGKKIDVIIETRNQKLYDILSSAYITQKGVQYPISEFVKAENETELKKIYSDENGQYYPVEINAKSSRISEDISKIRDIFYNDSDFSVNFEGGYFSNKEMVKDLMFIFFITLFLLFLILAAQFESLIQPLIILSELAIDIFASLLTLWVLGQSINLMSLIGLIVISGIIINDSILKIDTINKFRKAGIKVKDAISMANQRRLKAIIMTSLTSILSVCPFLSRGNMGDDLQFPMSIAIIAGMTIGTLVSLLIIPSLYYIIYKNQDE